MIIKAVKNAGLSIVKLDISNQNQQRIESSFVKQNQTNEKNDFNAYVW